MKPFQIASVVALLSFALTTPALAQDAVGNYGGVSLQFSDTDADFPVAAEGAFSITDNLQIRATLGDSLAAAALTASVNMGQWRFAAGPGLRYSERTETIEFRELVVDPDTGEVTEGETQSFDVEDNGTDFVGLLTAERAIGEYFVVFGSVSFSRNTSGAVGAGLRF